MIVPISIDIKYRQASPLLREIADRVRSIVTRRLERSGCAFIGRQKEVGSLAEKIETGRYRTWSELDDLYGCTIVIPTIADEPKMLDFLRSTFRQVELKGRGSSLKEPTVFRFDSTRFIGTLLPTISPEPPDALSQQKFEVQVSTAFEHAWTVATHGLVYKGESIDWRRLRLIAQLKAATEQMDNLITGFDTVAEIMAEQSWPEVTCRQLVEHSLRKRFSSGDIPRDCEPQSWVRFSENVYSLVRASTPGRRRFVEVARMESAIRFINSAIDKSKGEMFPRSISLLQFVFGALVSEGFIRGSLADYCPMITDQLLTVFPMVDRFGETFDFELTDT